MSKALLLDMAKQSEQMLVIFEKEFDDIEAKFLKAVRTGKSTKKIQEKKQFNLDMIKSTKEDIKSYKLRASMGN